MSEIIFRAIAPIFNISIEPNGQEFSYSGIIKNSSAERFSISLKRYEKDSKQYEELLKYADDSFLQNYGDRLHRLDASNTDYFLLVDVVFPHLSKEFFRGLGWREANKVTNAILAALELHFQYGISYHYIFNFSSIASPTGTYSHGASQQWNKRYIFFYSVENSSILASSEFERCRSTFEFLLDKQWNENHSFDRLLQLALQYHKTTFSIFQVEYRFLLLMIIFDSLFKSKSERNASQAASRISKLLSRSNKQRNKIQSEFFGKDASTFYRLRNSIAHGDPNLNQKMVSSKYWPLYRYISDAIIELIRIPDHIIDYQKDYYAEISRIIDDQFNSLPNR